MERALAYMDLKPGDTIEEGTPVDWVFIGSCANGRLSDLRAAASVVKGRRVAPSVRAWAVPGSPRDVKLAAEAEGLGVYNIVRPRSFEWREPGCSMCLGANGDIVPSGQRGVSTSNRSFVGRQGPGGRTIFASPVVAAAAALVQARSLILRKLPGLQPPKPLTTACRSAAAPLVVANINTDIIAPTYTPGTAGQPRGLYHDARGPHPSCCSQHGDATNRIASCRISMLNRAPFRAAKFIIAGANFGWDLRVIPRRA